VVGGGDVNKSDETSMGESGWETGPELVSGVSGS
jgi:hypothetical protein